MHLEPVSLSEQPVTKATAKQRMFVTMAMTNQDQQDIQNLDHVTVPDLQVRVQVYFAEPNMWKPPVLLS